MQNRRLLQNWGFNEIGGSMIKSIILKYFEEPLHIEIVRQTGKVYISCLNRSWLIS